jgi:hypothetical protein
MTPAREVDLICDSERLREVDAALNRVWQALEISEYTGKAVWEHVAEVVAEKKRLQTVVDAYRKDTLAMEREAKTSQSIADAIDYLRKDEGDSVEIACPNPEWDSERDNAVTCFGNWCGWGGWCFYGTSLNDALQNAVAARKTSPDPRAKRDVPRPRSEIDSDGRTVTPIEVIERTPEERAARAKLYTSQEERDQDAEEGI